MRMKTKIRVLPIVLTLGMVGMAYGALAAQDSAPETIRSARANVIDADGAQIGVVVFTPYEGGKVTVTADLEGLTPGFHGFHLHGTGQCDTQDDMDFGAAGSHLDLDGSASHPDHAGDLPPLLVTEDGEAFFSVRTDRFTIDDLLDEDGSAIMIHADPDNFAHFPERYDVTPDEDTLNTGDAGDRMACGVLEEWMAEVYSSSTAVPADGTLVPTQDPNMIATSENAETPAPAVTSTDSTGEPLTATPEGDLTATPEGDVTATPEGDVTATPETDTTPVATIVDSLETPTLPPQ